MQIRKLFINKTTGVVTILLAIYVMTTMNAPFWGSILLMIGAAIIIKSS
jgi:hypothetical protein